MVIVNRSSATSLPLALGEKMKIETSACFCHGSSGGNLVYMYVAYLCFKKECVVRVVYPVLILEQCTMTYCVIR